MTEEEVLDAIKKENVQSIKLQFSYINGTGTVPKIM